jgi:hypothetical protein
LFPGLLLALTLLASCSECVFVLGVSPFPASIDAGTSLTASLTGLAILQKQPRSVHSQQKPMLPLPLTVRFRLRTFPASPNVKKSELQDIILSSMTKLHALIAGMLAQQKVQITKLQQQSVARSVARMKQEVKETAKREV